jgi:hypothetical protein
MLGAELQVEKSRFFPARLLSKLIAEQIRRGQRYEKLCPVYGIAICNF